MPKQPEGRLTKKIMEALQEQYGGFWFKVHGGPYQQAGLPDIIGCCEGVFVGIEVKRPGREGTLTERQKAALQAVKDAGGVSGMATSVEDAFEILSLALPSQGPAVS